MNALVALGDLAVSVLACAVALAKLRRHYRDRIAVLTGALRRERVEPAKRLPKREPVHADVTGAVQLTGAELAALAELEWDLKC